MFAVWKYLFHANPKLSPKEQQRLYMLRHTIMGLISVSLMLLLNMLFHIPQALYGFLAAVLMVYADMSPGLGRQLGDIVMVTVGVCAVYGLGMMISVHIFAMAVFFLLAGILLYGAGCYDFRLAQIATISLTLLSFGVQVGSNWYMGLQGIIAILIGASTAMVSVVIMVLIPPEPYTDPELQAWVNALEAVLKTSALSFEKRAAFLNLSYNLCHKVSRPDDGIAYAIREFSIHYERFTEYLTAESLENLRKYFEPLMHQAFLELAQGFSEKNPILLDAAYHSYLDQSLSLRHQQIFKNFSLEQKIKVVYASLSLGKMVKNLQGLINLPEVAKWI